MKANTAVSNEQSISKLEEAFGIFNQVSADLGSSYQNLEARVASLKEELAASNSARIGELTEKERLAAKLSTLMDALPGGVIVVDAQGMVKEVNPAARRIIGKQFTGENWQQVMNQVTSIDPIYDGEFSLNDGRRLSLSSSPFGGDSDRIILVTDITENYRLNNVINREKRLTALGEMAARLAHQVRTPLSSAILYLSNLSTQLNTKPVQSPSKTIKSVQSQLGQIEKLVEGMLSYIKGDISANQTFSPITLLNEVKQATALQIGAANGVLNVIYSDSEFTITGDKEALFNALTNLVVNAIQSVVTEPCITLTLTRDENCIHISVEDYGPGIDESIRDKIFDPFFSTRPTGTGLGLAVVSSAVKAHNGEIVIESSPDTGTVFTLTIPEQQADLNCIIESQESR